MPCDPANDLFTYAPNASAIKKQCYTKECFWGSLQFTVRPESKAIEFDPGSWAVGYDTRRTFDLYGAHMPGETGMDTTLWAAGLTFTQTGFSTRTRLICSNPSTWHDSNRFLNRSSYYQPRGHSRLSASRFRVRAR